MNLYKLARRVSGGVLFVAASVLLTACDTKKLDSNTTVDASASMQKSIDAAAAGNHRSEKNRARNVYRNPAKTLAFFGLKEDMTVIEITPGGLWYTEVLAPVLKDKGNFIAAGYDVNIPDQPSYRYKQHEAMLKRFADDPKNYGNVKVSSFSPPDSLDLGAKGTADMVVTFRNSHGWIRDGVATKVYQAAFDALKPGGVFGVVQHRGENRYRPGQEKDGKISGYLPEQLVITTVESVGFVLEEKSEINANPKDTKDYAGGVWTLPPSLSLKDVDRDKFLAIGESDRMTLRFRKPL